MLHLPKPERIERSSASAGRHHLISPRGPIGRTPGTVATGDALRKLNITGATIVGGHGTTAKQVDIAAALAAN
jgi:hypothetical protein